MRRILLALSFLSIIQSAGASEEAGLKLNPLSYLYPTYLADPRAPRQDVKQVACRPASVAPTRHLGR